MENETDPGIAAEPVIDTEEIEKEAENPLPTDNQPKLEDFLPNIAFIGMRTRNGEIERLTEAPDTLISGPDTFDGLPSSEQQLNGFYYERAAELCRAFPGLYKRITKKGE